MSYAKIKLGNFKNKRVFEILISLGYSMKEAQRLCDKGRILNQFEKNLSKNEIANGEIFLIDYECQPKGLKPIFENENFAVFDKPSGVLSHPNGRNCKYSLYDEIWSLYGKNAGVAHRLDKETSGLILVAKDKKYLNLFKSLFEKKEIQKSYFALVSGQISQNFKIDAPIAKSLKEDEIGIKMRISNDGKEAITEIYPIKIFKNLDATLVKAVPLTGRQHQIRIHLFHSGHKIFGDPIYGVNVEIFEAILDEKLTKFERIKHTGASRLCLHAANLKFQFDKKEFDIYTKENFENEFLKSIEI